VTLAHYIIADLTLLDVFYAVTLIGHIGHKSVPQPSDLILLGPPPTRCEWIPQKAKPYQHDLASFDNRWFHDHSPQL
jgi:hypothetical protein